MVKKNICKKCGKEFPNYEMVNGKRKIYNRRRYCFDCSPAGLHNTKKLEKEIKVNKCKNCSNYCSSKNRFCNRNCHEDYKYKQFIQKWLNGDEKANGSISTYIVKYLKEKNSNKCPKCGWGEKNKSTNKVPLEVHHIDGNDENNCVDNLELLCPNCHALTKNYKHFNKKL